MAVLREVLLRPRWAWHRWRGHRDHVKKTKQPHQDRMGEYERFALPIEAAVAKVCGVTQAAASKALAEAPAFSAGERRAIPQWHDATGEFASLMHALVLLRKPRTVVETGVARGLSSAAILDAMERNGAGHLHSLDLPGMGRGYQEEVGRAVPAGLRQRWTLAFGPSAVKLPGILARAAPVDVFVHDSAHTYRNMHFEFAQAAKHLARSGLLVCDDVVNDALLEFVERHGWELVTVRQSKPMPWTYIGLARPR